MPLVDPAAITAAVERAVARQPVTDLHTHCFAPRFGASPDPAGLLLWGIDELVTYHYLIAEVFRVVPASELAYDKFWAMSKDERADHIWRELFVKRSPISEACRGVLTTLQALGLDPNEPSLDPYRRYFADLQPDDYVDRVMQLAGVDCIVMTNEVFSLWGERRDLADDPRFKAVLRIDPLLRDWRGAAKQLSEWGYPCQPDFGGDTVEQARRFLADWLDRMQAIYVAASLPPEFRYPAEADAPDRDRVIREILLPVLAERNVPWAMMIGSRLRVNPELGDAGDVVGKADPLAVANLCREFPRNRFLCTMLARENQHELCVVARKFGNLMLFGCWWFLNNPSLIREITAMRIELLGTSFIPQHSDARILDQLIYKWLHSRRLIAEVLANQYIEAVDAGLRLTEDAVQRDVALLLRDNFRDFVGLPR